MIEPKMYQVAKDMLNNMIKSSDDETLQVVFATTMLRAAAEPVRTEELMFRALGYAALIVHSYEMQNNLHADSPTTLSTTT